MANLEIPEKLLFLVNTKSRYKVAYGGRGSSKSWSFAGALIVLALQSKIRVLCARQLQTSIKDSVHKLLCDTISRMGLSAYFTITRDSIKAYNGSEFFFKGIQNNVNEIKSMEGIDYAWIEEAQSISQESLDILIPTIRKEGSEIWVSFNPDREEDPVFQMFVKNPRDDCICVKINYDENPWFPETLRREMEYCKRVDYGKYEHVWLGKTVINTEAQVFNGKFELKEFETPEGVELFWGADWGFAVDPTVLVRCFIKDRCLYVDYESGGVGVDFEEIPALFDKIPDVRKWQIRADSARPETISYVKRQGFNIVACPKWKGSVEDGIAYIRGFERVYIHPRCKNTYNEFKFYSYKQDRITGEVLPIVIDKDNHCLVAGTMITTQNGEKPIENITTNDYVLTRNGYRRVLWAGVSDKNRKVYKVTTDKGNYIISTENHKVLTSKGFCSIDALRYGDSVLIRKEECPKLSASKCMGENGGDTRILKEEAIENILNVDTSTYIILFGKNSGESVKKGMSFTTLMEIVKTMTYRILRKLRIKNTMAKGTNHKGITSKKSEKISIEQENLPINGIAVKRVLNGIKNMLRKIIGAFSICQKSNVRSAEKNLNLKHTTINFVQMPVNQDTEDEAALITLLSVANGVEQNLKQINILKQDFVVGHVLTIEEVGMANEVYDLTVDDCHEFFANGILVHNCIDGLRYALNPYIQKNVSILDVLD